MTRSKPLSLALFGFFLAAALPTVVPAVAQDRPADTNAIVRAKLQADKKLIVAGNMELTESEAKGFWPVYDEYQADLQKANDRILTLVKSYAEIYKSTATDAAADARARQIIDEKIAIDEAEASRDRAYVPKLAAVLPMRKVVRYLQLESKIRAIVRYEFADHIPVIE